jgi:hypothetical protein
VKRGKRAVKSDQRRYEVFVSHATADKWLAMTLCEKIELTGAVTFRDDRDIAGGDDIPDAIRKAISRANEMVVTLTPESVDRQWVLMEVGAAWQRGEGLRIIAVRQHIRIEPIPAILKSKKIVELNDFNRYLEELSRRVQHERV